MNRVFRHSLSLGAVALAAIVAPSCDAGYLADKCNDVTEPCFTGGAGGHPATTTSGPGGGAGGAVTGCDPSLEKNAVGDGCGVFVSSSKGDDAMGDGSKAKPFKTIGKAASAKKAIYLCGEKFPEAVSLTAGTSLFGGLKCTTDWSYDASTKSVVNGPSGSVALKVSGAGSSAVQDVAVTAADATMPGDSSIATLVDGTTVTFTRVTLTAGKPQDGAVGDTLMGTGKDGVKGPDGNAGCTNAMSVDPNKMLAHVDCGGGEDSTGGKGGSGEVGNAAPGLDGDATPSISNPNGGAGQTQALQCVGGGQGKPGAPGTPGDGAMGLGAIGNTGYAGTAGGSGKSGGKPGQGGGGGGGASGKQACSNTTFAGPAGAGGGSGGCGGAQGGGGRAAGSSIALVSLKADIKLTASTLIAADGAAGGKGSAGQPGGKGKGGGIQVAGDNNASCGGGQGGNGGQGGAGGGGLGGHSIGIAYTGTAPMADSATMTMIGKPGAGGAGGDGGAGNQGGKGDDGVAEKVKGFDAK